MLNFRKPENRPEREPAKTASGFKIDLKAEISDISKLKESRAFRSAKGEEQDTILFDRLVKVINTCSMNIQLKSIKKKNGRGDFSWDKFEVDLETWAFFKKIVLERFPEKTQRYNTLNVGMMIIEADLNAKNERKST